MTDTVYEQIKDDFVFGKSAKAEVRHRADVLVYEIVAEKGGQE